MKNKISSSILAALTLGLFSASTDSARAAVTVFSDPITNYVVGTKYVANNPQLIEFGAADALTLNVATNWGVWQAQNLFSSGSVTDQFVTLAGYYNQYTGVAVTNESSARYGQIYVRLASVGAYNTFTRLYFSSNSTPPVANTSDPFTVADGVGADVIWQPAAGGSELYERIATGFSSNYYQTTLYTHPTNEFYSVTINYDLLLGKYNVYLNTNQIFGDEPFANFSSISTIRSLALVSEGWSGNNPETAVLDQWYWLADETTPFTSFGQAIPEPSSLMIFGLGGLSLLFRRRRN